MPYTELFVKHKVKAIKCSPGKKNQSTEIKHCSHSEKCTGDEFRDEPSNAKNRVLNMLEYIVHTYINTHIHTPSHTSTHYTDTVYWECGVRWRGNHNCTLGVLL